MGPVIKLEHETTDFGVIWLSDTSYMEKLPKATMLVARELPPNGGDPLFANMSMAFDTLSDGMKTMLSGLNAVNTKADASATREDRLKTAARLDSDVVLSAVHPGVRTDPETVKKILYINVGHTAHLRA
ncbi:MAG: TauD/TfdA dioxygenase family protein [Rhodobacterales bacterium]